MANPLDQAAIAAILKKDSERPARSGGGGKKKDITLDRTYQTWFKLHHEYGTCQNPECIDDREGGGANGHAMVAEVKEHRMCRYCYIVGWLNE